MKYEWKPGYNPKVDANAVGRELEKLRQSTGGELHAEDVVEAARDPKNPLHSLFEWDDTEAAEKYRQSQARGVIQRLRVIVSQAPEQPKVVRLAYVSPQQVKHPGYVETEEAMADPVRRDALVRNALAALEGWLNRYRSMDLEELKPLVAKVESEVRKLRRELV